MKRPARITFGYVGAVTAALLVAVPAGWLSLSSAVDGDAYDWMYRLHEPERGAASSTVLAFDEPTLRATGGVRHLRRTLAATLEKVCAAGPAVTAIDIILSDEADPAEDAELERSLRGCRNVVLSADILPGSGRWEEPLPRFAQAAAAVGHVHANPDPVSRTLPLEKAADRKRYWAVALEAFRLWRNASITEAPDAIEVGGAHIRAARANARPMYIRYGAVPVVPVLDVQRSPEAARRLAGRVVFVGVTALTAAKDRLMTPLGQPLSGVEIHANAFETLAGGRFHSPVSLSAVVLVCVVFAVCAGAIFAFLSGWPAYLAAAALIAVSHAAPHLAFRADVIVPYTAPMAAAWLTVGTAAAWQYFVVRKQLFKSEADKARYQQAIHFVTHEMRSPLTAIQGSSELMGRYNLNDAKRKQIATMINTESKRLARMVQTFLDIERLTEGQMEMRSETFDLGDLIATCLQRAEPLAARKGIAIATGNIDRVRMTGDRELMEYALYNLLTNAVKYSPADTQVMVETRPDPSSLRISVRDQGIGMDAQELNRIFQKFYRTRRAEASGEAGTGIGLSLVEQIVSHHGGRMEVTSTPGKGSCFTMVIPRGILAAPVSGSATPSRRLQM